MVIISENVVKVAQIVRVIEEKLWLSNYSWNYVRDIKMFYDFVYLIVNKTKTIKRIILIIKQVYKELNFASIWSNILIISLIITTFTKQFTQIKIIYIVPKINCL